MVAVMLHCIHGVGGGGEMVDATKIAVVFQVCFQMHVDHGIMQLEVWKFQCWEIFCIRLDPPISLWFCSVNLMQNISQHWNFQTSSCIIPWSTGIWKQTWKTTAIFVTYFCLPPPPPHVYNGALQPPFLWNCLVFLGKHISSTRWVNS